MVLGFAKLSKTIRTLGMTGLVAIALTACGSSSGGDAASTSSESTTIQNGTVSSTTKVSELNVGDIYPVTFSEGNATIDFTDASSSSQYELVVQSTNTSGGSSSVTLGDVSVEDFDSMAKALDISTNEISTDVGDAFDTFLRFNEEDLAINEVPVEGGSRGVGKSVAKTLSSVTTVGDQESFRVLASLTSTTSYADITATVVCVTDHLVVALDNNDGDIFTAQELQDLCTISESSAAIDVAVLGDASDINGDGRLTFLLTDRVNRLGGQGGGIVTGFFYAADLYPRTGSNPVSNEQEIVFALVPDPSGEYGSAISKSFALNNLLNAVLPHEIQHAISYNQHVLLRGGSPERTWLNEALSHNMECVTGYCQENPSRVDLFLNATATTSLVSGSSANLKQRGASFLFIRFLYEQSSDGNAFLARLVGTDKTEVDNIENAFAGTDSSFDQFEEFFMRWAVAVGMTNAGIISDSRYVFKDRTYNSTTSQWDGVCLQCIADDGRGTVLDGPSVSSFSGSSGVTLAPTGTAYYSLSAQSDPLTITGSSSANLQAVLIRTR
ncbi:MAG: hypothetical protein COV45_03510 [Deltaproteobacteria bacterium CG11_big_fil_rev_8_21_14_0_20_47_16]|nr:MAG: hypothetical protein COV45_03510 [Deltaproteobacteria bacterium CG11_big_fil_rev_8_21_14_0_20_47_16]